MESSGQTPVPPPGAGMPPDGGHDYPLTFAVDYPDRSLDRLTTALRIFTVIPVAILAATIEGGGFGSQAGGDSVRYAGGGIGVLFIPVLLMLLFRKKYPRWWYDWNLQLTRFRSDADAMGSFGFCGDRGESPDGCGGHCALEVREGFDLVVRNGYVDRDEVASPSSSGSSRQS